MKKINLNREWEFIQFETHTLALRNIPILIRELLFIAQIILVKYSHAKTTKMKCFYKKIYLKTKKQYVERN